MKQEDRYRSITDIFRTPNCFPKNACSICYKCGDLTEAILNYIQENPRGCSSRIGFKLRRITENLKLFSKRCNSQGGDSLVTEPFDKVIPYRGSLNKGKVSFHARQFLEHLIFSAKMLVTLPTQRRDLSNQAIWNHFQNHHGVCTYVVVKQASNYYDHRSPLACYERGIIVQGKPENFQ